MAIVPLKLPSGMYRNGTPYSARGRWTDGNLVRWHDGSLRPIGGWRQLTAAPAGVVTLSLLADEIVRDAISFVTTLGLREALFFSNKRVFRKNQSNAVTDVTPSNYPQGDPNPSVSVGYGTGPYGDGPYGVARPIGGQELIKAHRVSSSLWGENVLYAVVDNGPIYQHVPGPVPAAELANAPSDVADLIVTDQRIVMTIQNSGEVRLVIWSDRENNEEWAPTQTNFAGSQRLQGAGPLIGLYKIQNQILILSESDAHIARYIGAPFVYGFERVGVNCQPLDKNAVQETDRFVVWMGERNFWIYDGTVKILPCDVTDFLFKDISFTNVSKIHTQTVAEFSEIWWFYQSENSATGDVDSYVVYDYSEGHWATGKLERTAGYDRGASLELIMVDKAGRVYEQELSSVAVVGAFAESGPLELENGGRNMALRYVFPDTEQFGSVRLYFKTRQMPTDVERTLGPFEYRNPISTTGVLGREIRMRAEGLTNNWEVGTMRADVQEVGGGFR